MQQKKKNVNGITASASRTRTCWDPASVCRLEEVELILQIGVGLLPRALAHLKENKNTGEMHKIRTAFTLSSVADPDPVLASSLNPG